VKKNSRRLLLSRNSGLMSKHGKGPRKFKELLMLREHTMLQLKDKNFSKIGKDSERQSRSQ